MKTYPNCKINLGLHVMRKRDDGYHDLETIFVPVSLHDELEISPANTFAFLQDGISIDGDPDTNLVVRAYRLMQQHIGPRLGNVEIHLTKKIPTGAGLGGGSSDAAFTLAMLNKIFNLNIGTKTLQTLASKLGADCAFFIENRTAFATGIGDQLSPLPYNPLDKYKLLLIKPDEFVSTAEAYRNIIPRAQRTHSEPIDLRDAIGNDIQQWKNTIVNDFESSVFAEHPRLNTIKKELYDAGALYAAMSGSGATIYGIFPSDSDTDKLKEQFNDGVNFVALCDTNITQ
ncbi:MAG: 4-(cytidine 5'-diphospho)-2-C-methyl-D-erythritol kinase [Bacteroidales bacterium]|nr:4-(cytidine 5'-diphospho)-2-C-methyl-D-erythritol kinase [Bacteroidales bacterium]